jgi:hypothetical protein
MNLKESFQEIKNIVLSELPDSKIYLYGESLRFLLENKKPTELKIFIETKKSENIILVSQYLLKFKNLSPSFGKKLKLENEILTVNCIYLNIDDVLSGNISTGCFYGGLKDNSKKIIKLTPFGKEELQKNPKIKASVKTAIKDGVYKIFEKNEFDINNNLLPGIDKYKAYLSWL